METRTNSNLLKLFKSNFVYKWWYRVVIWLAAGAVFVTTYVLMLPAFTDSIPHGTKEILGYGIKNDQIYVNNVYPIHAVLGEEAAYRVDGTVGSTTARTNTILTSKNIKTIWLDLPLTTGNSTCNLGSYFYGSNSDNVVVGTTTVEDIKELGYGFHIDLDEWCGIRVEYSDYYESFFVAQIVYGGEDEKTYDSEDGHANRIKNLGVQSAKGFILLVRKSFLAAGNESLEGTAMPMYIPSCDAAPNDWNGTGGKTIYGEMFYEAHDKVHLNEAPLKEAPYKNNTTETATSLYDVPGFRPLYNNDFNFGKYSFGYVTFSPYMDQNDTANAVALPNDVPMENLAENITFKLFDYSNNINKKINTFSLFDDETYTINNCVPIANYFNFRNKDHVSTEYKNYWGQFAACVCGATSADLCNGNSDGHESILHRNNIYDADGFTINHSLAYYRLWANTGHPILYLKHNATGVAGDRDSNINVDINTRDLSYLFDGNRAQEFVNAGNLAAGAVTQYNPVNTILQYDPNTSTYSYDSAFNAVDYNKNTNTFYVRGYTERNDDSAQVGVDNTNYFDFLPFNYGNGIITETYSNYTDGYASTLREASFQRKSIYPNAEGNRTTDYNNVNYWFGMTMEFTFIQGKDGQITYIDSEGNTITEDMIFTFSGDDDVWVFVDGVKVLDLGGTHGAVTGEINFNTGEIKQFLDWNNSTENDSLTSFPTDLKTCFERASRVNSVEWNDEGTTFEDYTVHTLKFYYLERGGCVANCSIKFNLQTFNDKSLVVSKELAGNGSDADLLESIQKRNEFQFRVLNADQTTLLINEGATYKILDNGVDIGTGTVGADGIFTLKHGQQAIFEDIWELTDGENNGPVEYFIEEIIPADQVAHYPDNPEYTIKSSSVINSDTIQSTVGTTTKKEYADGSVGYISAPLTSAETQTIIFKNVIDENSLYQLSISKEVELYPSGAGTGSFDVQVQINDELLPVGTVYYVNGTTKKFVATAGIVTVEAGSSVVIKGLVNGTTYVVQETASSMEGYVVYYDGVIKNNVSGTINAANVSVAIKNKQGGNNIQIDVFKTLENVTSNADFDFNFTLTQVYKDSNDKFIDNQNQDDIMSITISGDANEGKGQGVFNLQYIASDYEMGESYCYYKITETVNEGDRSSLIDYDSTSFIVTVKLNKISEGAMSVEIDSILQYTDGDITGSGTEIYKDGLNGSVEFINTINLYTLPSTGGSGEKLSASQFAIGYILLVGAVVCLLCCITARGRKKD